MDTAGVESHYGRTGLGDRFLDALGQAGVDTDNLEEERIRVFEVVAER